MKIYLPLALLLLASCSSKEQKNDITSENQDSVTVLAENIEVTTENNTPNEKSMEVTEIKALINQDFKNLDKLILKNEFGGGDCFGTYQQNNIKEKGSIATIYKMDCNDYGFTNYRLISSEENTPLFLEKVKYENDMSGEQQLLEEWVINFQDTSKVYYRKAEKVDYEMTTIADDVKFQLYEGSSLNINEGLSEIEAGKTEELYE
ncbi:hypothetical protein WAF17_10055 [Bernardetia sp. ABR2-2B]|uniref:hypothetical protein n=1 Tax=Bernardetia sp. ABR2-2B TaxID=3127472 RepID=UPI0030D3A7AA